MKQDKEFLHNITFSTTAMRRIYVVLTHDVRMNNINTFNQQKIINQIVKRNSSLHKNLNIVRIVWTKKIKRLWKKHFSLIIEFVNFEIINKLIKSDLLNDYSHWVCKYFEKNARSNNVFDVENMIMSTKFVEMMKNAIFMCANISRSNTEHSTNTKNMLIALTSTSREVFNATLKRKKK
jgi:hypothetical protein